MSTVISICNHKGGVGKSTTCTNLGAALANKGRRVLVIDLDAQSNLSEHLGVQEAPQEKDVYRALRGETKLSPIEIYEGLSLIPSTLDLAAAEIELTAEAGGEFVLKEQLDEIKDNYDYVLIDCSPSISSLVINALVASDSLIIPMQAEYLALRGLTKLTDVLQRVQRRLNK